MCVNPNEARRYNEICTQYYDAILSFCNARMGFRLEDAKDCTQQVFQLLLEKLPTLDTENNIRAWLYRVARNMVGRYYDQQKKEENKLLYLEELSDYEEAVKRLVTEDRYEDMDEKREWAEEELIAVKERVLSSLDTESRHLLELRYEKGLSYRQISGMMNVSENTLRQRAFVLKGRIKKLVGKLFVDPD